MRGLALFAATVGVACQSASPGASVSDAGASETDGGDALASLAPPRPIAPISVSFLTSRQPVFAWELPGDADGARVEVCSDRSCAHVVSSFDAAGDRGAPPEELPPGVVFWRLRARSGKVLGSPTSATWEAVVPAQSSKLATAWGAMLDADGDGFADVVVGDSDAFTATQRVFVHAGGPGGPSPLPTSVLTGAKPVALYAGSIASAGDVDGDGFGDLLVGSSGEATVYVYRGGLTGFADPPALLQGPAASQFGASVSGAGDVDGDGYADVVVGMPLSIPADGGSDGGGGPSGGAKVLLGGPDGLSLARSKDLAPPDGSDAQGFGRYVSTAGDTNGDGLADVAVWAGIGSTDPQLAAVYAGGQPFVGSTLATLRYPGTAINWLGNACLLVCAGDVNGDGYSDIAVSSPGSPDGVGVNLLSLFFGGPHGPGAIPSREIVSPMQPTDHFGLSLAAGDLNSDGLDDLVAGSLAAPASSPISAIVYAGSTQGPVPSVHMPTLDTTQRNEREIGVGDVDGDGYPDVFVAFPARATPAAGGGVLHGAVEIHRGGPGGASGSARWTLLPPDSTAAAYGGSLVRP